MKKVIEFVLTLASICTIACNLNSQEVSTLVNDSSREFESIHWLADGRILSIDFFGGKVYEIKLDGSVTTLVSGFVNLAGGGVDKTGNFYFSRINAGSILRLNGTNSHTTVVSGLNTPVGILPSDNEDEIFVVSYSGNALLKANLTTGASSLVAAFNGINGPDGLIYHPDGDILIANYNNHLIHKVNPSGGISLFATIPSSGNLGYIAGGENKFYTASVSGKKIYEVSLEGEVTHVAGTGAAGSNDGDVLLATFSEPNGVALSPTGDSLLVTDKNTVRLISGLNTISDVQESELKTKFRFYPNPVNNIINIETLYESPFKKWQIVDHQGKIIKESRVNSTDQSRLQISIEKLTEGVYFLRVLTHSQNQQVQAFYKAYD